MNNSRELFPAFTIMFDLHINEFYDIAAFSIMTMNEYLEVQQTAMCICCNSIYSRSDQSINHIAKYDI